ncbi:hypothetical protein ERE07_17965 [Allopusillimonas ginsengisoli]|nr:hypothetical protein ERE07_17965 [Allopusillimonas ginsengisoli]
MTLIPHLGSELLMQTAALKATHIPYQGGGPALNSVLSGQTEFLFSSIMPVLSKNLSKMSTIPLIVINFPPRWSGRSGGDVQSGPLFQGTFLRFALHCCFTLSTIF